MGIAADETRSALSWGQGLGAENIGADPALLSQAKMRRLASYGMVNVAPNWDFAPSLLALHSANRYIRAMITAGSRSMPD